MNMKFKLFFFSIALVLSNLFFVSNASAQLCPSASSPSINLGPNQSLNRGQSISLGSTLLAHQTDGNVVVYVNGRAVWWTGTAGRATTTFVMQTDGNLVLYGPSGAVWFSGTQGSNYQVFRIDANCVNLAANGRPTGIVGIGSVVSGNRFAMYRAFALF
jgi:hypothetical protein